VSLHKRKKHRTNRIIKHLDECRSPHSVQPNVCQIASLVAKPGRSKTRSGHGLCVDRLNRPSPSAAHTAPAQPTSIASGHGGQPAGGACTCCLLACLPAKHYCPLALRSAATVTRRVWIRPDRRSSAPTLFVSGQLMIWALPDLQVASSRGTSAAGASATSQSSSCFGLFVFASRCMHLGLSRDRGLLRD
jgi:hypothetical protein